MSNIKNEPLADIMLPSVNSVKRDQIDLCFKTDLPSPGLAITSDTVAKSEDCPHSNIESCASQPLASESEKEFKVPIVKPEPSQPKLAVVDSKKAQEELVPHQGMKMTSQPTAIEEQRNDKKDDSNPPPQVSGAEKGIQQVVQKTLLNKNILLMSARERLLLKRKQQAASGVTPSVASPSQEKVHPIETPVIPASATTSSLDTTPQGKVDTPKASISVTPSSIGTISEAVTNSSISPQEQSLFFDPKKQRNTKEKKIVGSTPKPMPPPKPFSQALQPKISELKDDLETLGSDLVLPKCSNLDALACTTNAFSLEDHSRILLVSEFFRVISPEMLPDWPSVLFEPQLIELLLLVPPTSFLPLFPFLVAHLSQILLGGDESVSMADLQGVLNSMSGFDVDLSSCNGLQKLDLLERLVDQITQLPIFGKWVDNKVSLGTPLIQKKRDLIIAYDSIGLNLSQTRIELDNSLLRGRFIQEQIAQNPQNSFIALQAQAVQAQIASNEEKAKKFQIHLNELAVRVQEIETAQFSSPAEALIHGQLMGPIEDAYVVLLGKDRFGRAYWFWRCFGGVFIEASPCPGLTFTPETPHWEYIGDVTQLKSLMDSLNHKGLRESKLLANLSANQQLIIDSIPDVNRWLQHQKDLRALSGDSLGTYLADKLSEFRSRFDTSNSDFSARVSGFGSLDLLTLIDRLQYDNLTLLTMRERLAKLKLYLFDQSAILIENKTLSSTSQQLLTALHTADTLEKGIRAAHNIFDRTVPLLEACKGLTSPLSAREKGIRRNLVILLTWIRTSQYYKDILYAATDSTQARFPSVDHFCAWLNSILDYLSDLHQDEIIESERCFNTHERKLCGLVTLPCKLHSAKESCHYHATTLPKNLTVEVVIPSIRKPAQEVIPLSNSTNYNSLSLRPLKEKNEMPLKYLLLADLAVPPKPSTTI
ncbi:hypothetical protein DSO57_1023103 [Entomophthora muscae]|uniref:Uncharacterized protein n=1 Tax=Entomophthora muscae TaxID=34485 RepID=A0ACC2U0T1_9FUNG|nr:hypothetical protein DSO57_1023103 [Entomophthora muscae]